MIRIHGDPLGVEADSVTPLGWPHALRLATVALMDERGVLYAAHKIAAD